MPTRRDVLLASIAAGVAMKTRTAFAKGIRKKILVDNPTKLYGF